MSLSEKIDFEQLDRVFGAETIDWDWVRQDIQQQTDLAYVQKPNILRYLESCEIVSKQKWTTGCNIVAIYREVAFLENDNLDFYDHMTTEFYQMAFDPSLSSPSFWFIFSIFAQWTDMSCIGISLINQSRACSLTVYRMIVPYIFDCVDDDAEAEMSSDEPITSFYEFWDQNMNRERKWWHISNVWWKLNYESYEVEHITVTGRLCVGQNSPESNLMPIVLPEEFWNEVYENVLIITYLKKTDKIMNLPQCEVDEDYDDY